MHPGERGVAAVGERAQQIERGRRLGVGLDLARRVGHARRLVELQPVHDVAAVARQLDARPGVSVGAERGLANCPAIRPTFTTGIAAP